MSGNLFTRRGVLAAGVATTLGLAGCAGSNSDSTPTGQGADGTATEGRTATDTLTATSTEATAEPSGAVETVVSVPGERVPENMAFDADGALHFGITAGEVRRLPAARIGEPGVTVADTDQVATLPGAIGVEVGPDGTIYVAVATQDDDAGVWSVPPGAEASQLAGISGFPNDILFDADRDRLLVTESTGGVVYAVGTDGSRETWLDDGRLRTEGFGANGITRTADGTIYVAVTQAGNVGRLVEVPVGSDGDAGEASTLLESEAIVGADGITARDGDVYVAANSRNRVLRVDSEGDAETVLDADDGLVFPSDVLFAPGSDDLFVCNFANQSPDDGAILRARL